MGGPIDTLDSSGYKAVLNLTHGLKTQIKSASCFWTATTRISASNLPSLQNKMMLFCSAFPRTPHIFFSHWTYPFLVHFGPLKKRYSDEILSLASSGLSVTKPKFLQVYAKIRNETITTRAGRAAFKSVGICDIVTAAPV